MILFGQIVLNDLHESENCFMWLKSHLHKTVAAHGDVDRKSSLFHYFTESVQFLDADP